VRLFFDTCCLNRPWDDQSQIRIHLEAEAVLYLVEAARQGRIEMATSDYLLAEILCQPDPIRCIDVMGLTSPAALHISQSPAIETKAQALVSFHITENDALHVITAEAAQCDFLLTTDDRLKKRCQKAAAQSAITIQVLNPTEFLPYLMP
jgi:predicted nucleic acid-binding protein